MLDDRTNRHSPKPEVLKVFPKATCHKVDSFGYVVRSNEAGQPPTLGSGRSAWDAWMVAEMMPRHPEGQT